MNEDEVREAFRRHGVLQTGHFKLSSGRHSDQYLQKQALFEYPRLTARMGKAIAELFEKGSFDVVVSPALGAILLGNAVAYAADTRFVYAERVDGEMKLRRGQIVHMGERALIVEDIVTTGGSAAEVVHLVEQAGATVAGVAVLADRSNEPVPFQMTALLRVDANDWDPSECPLCAEDRPMDSPGSRFLASS